MKLGSLFLIPTPVSDAPLELVFPMANLDRLRDIRHFMVEKEKPARTALKRLQLSHPISELILHNIGKYSNSEEFESYFSPIFKGLDMGLLSDAGCPGIADPGSVIVKFAHQFEIPVVPLVGPSSIFLALMASGLNGQNFAFNGYLPVKENERAKKLRELEHISAKTGQTQICIETPYRNEQLFETMKKTLRGNTQLCLAVDTTSEREFIKTRTVSEWKSSAPLHFQKQPCVFLFEAEKDSKF